MKSSKQANEGYHIETDQAKKPEFAHGHLEYLDDMINRTEVELYVCIRPYYAFVEFVSTMPSMTELNSTIIPAETGVDMDILKMQNTCVLSADRPLPTMNPQVRKICPSCQGGRLFETNDDIVCPCRNQKQRASLFRSQV